jgi:hypothetical protein
LNPDVFTFEKRADGTLAARPSFFPRRQFGEFQMANGSGGDGGGTSVLAFILGGAIVLIAIFGFFVYTGHHGTGGNGVQVTANVTPKH